MSKQKAMKRGSRIGSWGRISILYRGAEGFPCGSAVKNLPAIQEMQELRVPPLGLDDPLE